MVQKNLQDLVAHYLPGNCTDDAIQRLVSYSMRILSARMQTSVTQHGSADSDHIKQLLIKKGKPSLIDASLIVVQQNHKEGLNTVPGVGRKGPLARPVTVGEEI